MRNAYIFPDGHHDMKPWLKITLYTVLAGLLVWTTTGFIRSYRLATATTSVTNTEGETASIRVNNKEAQSRMSMFGFGGLLAVLGLGLMLSRDISHWFATRTTDFLYNDNLEGMQNPDFDRAEAAAMQGNYMDAVGMLRDFLKKNPREIYAQIRIAEIYENELKNYLAAALEYEDLLQHKFNGDRWGWAAIHLANLYSGKLDKPDQTLAWLRRIATEYPETGPAKKARERLGLPETGSLPPPQEPPPSSGGLPPGFSPKKRSK